MSKRYALPSVNPGDSIAWSALNDSKEIREYEIDRERGTQGFVTYEGIEFHEIPYCTFGDYDNSTQVERSNHRVMRERFPFLVHVYGGHGSAMLGYLGSLESPLGAAEYDAEHDNDEGTIAGELQEAIEGLNEYPILDEQDESELECEAEQEAWSAYGCRDFASWLTKPHKGIPNFGIPAGTPLGVIHNVWGLAYSHDLTYTDHPNDPTEVSLRRDLTAIYFEVLTEYGSGETSRHEGGGSVYFDFDDWYRTFWRARNDRATRLANLDAARATLPEVGKLESAITNGDYGSRDVLCDLLSDRGFDGAVSHLRYYSRDSLGQLMTALGKLADEWTEDEEEDEATA